MYQLQKVTITNQKIVESIVATTNLLSAKLPVKVAWTLNKNLKKINELYTDIDTFRSDIIKNYAQFNDDGNIKQDDKGNIVLKSSEDANKLAKEINDLLTIENNIEFNLINISDIIDCEVIGSDLITVDYMFVEDNS